MQQVKNYYKLTKPGIIYGNILTGIAGFFIAANGTINPRLLGWFVLGLGLVIASACVLNNIIDRNIDAKMTRTKKRAVVTGAITLQHAYIFSVVLGATGFLLLAVFVNWWTVWLGAAAYMLYIAAYGVAKRTTVHGTLVGSVPGAIPPAAGYVAVTGYLDEVALLLFIILVVWQMPHFYAIAMFRHKEYAAANLPVLPIVKGVFKTKQQIVVYILAFIVASQVLVLTGRMGIIYSLGLLILGLTWLCKAVKGFQVSDNERWARGIFGFSLVVLLGFCVFSIIDAWVV